MELGVRGGVGEVSYCFFGFRERFLERKRCGWLVLDIKGIWGLVF